METTTGLLRKWTLASAVTGLAGAAIVGAAATVVALAAPSVAAISQLSWVLLPVAALAFGLILGRAQWRVLGRVVVQLEGESWLGATLAGSLMAAVTTLAITGWATPAHVEPVFLLPLAVAAGGLAGALQGLAQALVLRQHVKAGATWVAANLLGWAAGFAVGFLGASAASTLPAIPRMLAMLATGTVAGAVTGLLLGAVLAAVLREAGLVRRAEESGGHRPGRPTLAPTVP